MATGLYYSERFTKHMTGFDHPERPRRVSYVREKLEETGMIHRLKEVVPLPQDTMWLYEVHGGKYIDHLRRSAHMAPTFLDPDTVMCPESFEIAMLSAFSGIQACEEVIQGRMSNAFCLTRPPGHHAERNEAMGFCFFNNAAVAAQYLRVEHGLKRVLIVDWDVHHGNGTQHIFYDTNEVFYFSVHQWPSFPGTGAADESGEGDGKGFTLNVPMKPGSGNDAWENAFLDNLYPAIQWFEPEFIIVSAGFDAHWEDPLAGQHVTDDGFQRLSELVRNLAEKYCGGRLVSILEGGYDVASLSRSIHAHLDVLIS